MGLARLASLASLAPIGLAATVAIQQPVAVQRPEPALRPEITREELEAHVRFLASDELEGRMTGTAGGEKAARYLAKVLEREGVAPAASDGTYLQPVRLVRRRMTAAPELALSTQTGETIQAVFGRDFEAATTSSAIAGARVVIVRAASDLPAKAEADLAVFVDVANSKRRQLLADAGHPEGEGFALVVQAGSSQAGRPAAVDSNPSSLQRAGARRSSVRIRGPLLERLRAGEIKSLSLATHVEEEVVEAFNVVGRIEGRGREGEPDLASEAVVLSAHYDHLGLVHGAPKSGEGGAGNPDAGAPPTDASTPRKDLVFNGADDDASGCAAVLELAGAFAAGPRPARTLVFLLATGEEIGLLGTEEYLDHPVAPLERTVANLNFEMIGRSDPLVGGAGVLWLTGWDRTDLGAALQTAGLAVKPDPRLDEHFFERSDNYAFVRRGVVGQTLSTYNLHKDYHTPADEADRLDYAHMEACARAGYEAARLVADGKIRPQWLEGQDPRRR